jgi:hypothetical protein
MGRMKRLLSLLPLILLAPAACKSTPEKDPENQVTAVVDKEFARFRPVAIAVLKSEAPASQLRDRSRVALSRQLIDRKKYSPIRLEVVDAQTNSNGKFEPGSNLAVDATAKLTITRWKPMKSKAMYRCDAELVITHTTGVELFRCTLRDGGIKVVDSSDATGDFRHSANAIVAMLIEKLPECQPAAAE